MHHQLLHDGILDEAVDVVKGQLAVPDAQSLFEYIEIVLDAQNAVKERDVITVIFG
jgi:hypothetical protein